jgi:hypothetical protein
MKSRHLKQTSVSHCLSALQGFSYEFAAVDVGCSFFLLLVFLYSILSEKKKTKVLMFIAQPFHLLIYV